jgi:nucleoside-diphosphate-sugar epimerase
MGRTTWWSSPTLKAGPRFVNGPMPRDVARGCVRVLEVPAAIGEAFNLGGTAPFAELGFHLAERLRMTCVTARLPIARVPWYISSAKARGILGYTPRHTVFSMVDEATVH